MNMYEGKIVLMKSEFIKFSIPLWQQYDEDNLLQLDKEEFFMVAQDTL